MWNGLENAAAVAQAVGLDVGGLISMIGQAARTARQNTNDCEHLGRRVGLLAELVPPLQEQQDPEARQALAGLQGTLTEAHRLVMFCQTRGRTAQLFLASRLSERFQDVDRRIDTHLSVIPVITSIAIVRHLSSAHRSQSLSQLEEPSTIGSSRWWTPIRSWSAAATGGLVDDKIRQAQIAEATDAQLVGGVDAGGLIAKIRQAARTAQQNNKDCELLARLVDMLGELLPDMMRQQDPEAVQALAELDGTLLEAHDLVMDCQCQERGLVRTFITASRIADRFRDVEKKIVSYLSLIPVISYIGIPRLLDAIHTNSLSLSSMLLDPCGMPRPLPLDFLKSITSDFSAEQELGKGGFGVVYKVSLQQTRSSPSACEFAECQILGTRRRASLLSAGNMALGEE